MVFGSSAMPQIGQAPGVALTISGCIGQVHSTDCKVLGAGCVVRVPGAGCGVPCGVCLRAIVSGATADIERGPRASQPSGSVANFARHPGEQNQYVAPA